MEHIKNQRHGEEIQCQISKVKNNYFRKGLKPAEWAHC